MHTRTPHEEARAKLSILLHHAVDPEAIAAELAELGPEACSSLVDELGDVARHLGVHFARLEHESPPPSQEDVLRNERDYREAMARREAEALAQREADTSSSSSSGEPPRVETDDGGETPRTDGD